MKDANIDITMVRTLHWHIGVLLSDDAARLVYLQELGKELGVERLAAYPETVKRLEEKAAAALARFAEEYPGSTRETVVKTFHITGLSTLHFAALNEMVSNYTTTKQRTL